MLYIEHKDINPADIDIDAFMSHLINDSFTKLIAEVKSEYKTWIKAGYYLESYMADKMFEVLDLVIGAQKDKLDPIERTKVLTTCADPKHTPAEKLKRIKPFAEPLKEIDWNTVTQRAAILSKALHRSAAVATLVLGDRLWEEYQIVAKKFKIADPNITTQNSLYASSVNASLLLLIRALDHALYLKLTDKPAIMLTRNRVVSAFPKVEMFDEVIDAAVECLNYFGTFIPVVQKTITEQRNPYMLCHFTQDLVLLFKLVNKNKGILTEQQLREGVAAYSREQELRERTITWMQTYLVGEYMQQQLKRPFAQKISTALARGDLGRGQILKLLREKIAKSSHRTKFEAAFILEEILKNASYANIAGVSVTVMRSCVVFTDDTSEEVDFAQTIQVLKDKKLIPIDRSLTNKDQLQIKELAGIIRFIRAFTR